MKTFVKEKIESVVKHLESLIELEKIPVNVMDIKDSDYKKDGCLPIPDSTWRKFMFGDVMQGVDKHYWLYKRIKTPPKTLM